MANSMSSAPAWALASRIAWRSEPGPASVRVDDPDDRESIPRSSSTILSIAVVLEVGIPRPIGLLRARFTVSIVFSTGWSSRIVTVKVLVTRRGRR